MPSFAELLVAYMRRSGMNNAELASITKVRRDTLLEWTVDDVSMPLQRDVVLRCAHHLGLSQQEREEFLLAAGFESERETLPVSTLPTLPISLVSWRNSAFVVGPPITEPRQFFGREYILKRIFDVWKYLPLQHVAIVGLKRSGKTSLLHYLRRIIDTPAEKLRTGQRNDWLMPGYQWVFVDFQDPRMCYQESLLRHILIELDLPVPEPSDLVSFMEIVDQYLEFPTLILLDEIGAGLASPDLDEQFWWGMRSLGSNHAGGKVGFLFTAHQAPEDIILDDNKPSPFFNIFGHVLNLGPLTEVEALEFINSSPQPFEKKDIKWILAQSGRWPALLQILCHSRLIALEEGRHDNAWQAEALRRIKPYRYLLEQRL
ncbi:MAG TPA: ATP-binding protein [Thioploca sp.]|nr:ATP-binding protein [Thioploca sp.]